MTPADAWVEAAQLLDKGKEVEILFSPHDPERGTRIVLYPGEGERFLIFVGVRRVAVGSSPRNEYVAMRLNREAGRKDIEVREYAGYKEKVETLQKENPKSKEESGVVAPSESGAPIGGEDSVGADDSTLGGLL